MNKPDSLVRLYILGSIPSIFKAYLKNFPNRELSGEFYRITAFNKPGKAVKMGDNDIQVQFLDWLDWANSRKLSHARVFFFNLNSRSDYKEIGKVFDLTANCSGLAKFPQTVIGIMKKPIRVLEEERKALARNKCIKYHEIVYNDFDALEHIFFSLIEQCSKSAFALLKVSCLGSGKKTEIVRSFAEGKFETDYLPTLGVDITTKKLDLYGLILKIIIVDTAGQEFFGKLRPSYYRGSSGGIIFIDYEDELSLQKVKEWYNEFRSHIPNSNIPVTLVGIDPEKSSIPIDEIKEFAEDSNMRYYEVNLKNVAFISKVFEDLVIQIFKKVS